MLRMSRTSIETVVSSISRPVSELIGRSKAKYTTNVEYCRTLCLPNAEPIGKSVPYPFC